MQFRTVSIKKLLYNLNFTFFLCTLPLILKNFKYFKCLSNCTLIKNVYKKLMKTQSKDDELKLQ